MRCNRRSFECNVFFIPLMEMKKAKIEKTILLSFDAKTLKKSV